MPEFTFTPLWFRDLKRTANPVREWLWQGYLTPGAITLLTSPWKTGKTTLLCLLLDRMKSGGDLCGHPVHPGKVAVISEESADLWLERGQRYHFAKNVCWFCRPFDRRPAYPDWKAFLDCLLDLHHQVAFSLLAVDPLAAFLPSGSENNSDAALNALSLFRPFTDSGLSVLLLHHPTKAARAEGNQARGSGVLCSHPDILMELQRLPSDLPDDRRRRLLAWSRWDDTPRSLLLSLTPEADDYFVLPDDAPDATRPIRDMVWAILSNSRVKLTVDALLEEWPQEVPCPVRTTVWRILNDAFERDEMRRDGHGVRADPYRYWLPSSEERWHNDPLAQVLQSTADARRELANRAAGLD